MPVTVEYYKAGGRERIGLWSPWYPGVQNDCKAITGHNWSQKQGRWSYPLSLNTCYRLREVFGDQLVIGPALKRWVWAEQARVRKLNALAKVHDADLLVVPAIAPRLATAMGDRTYQRSAARFGATAGSFLLADEPGLGKTATSFAVLMESGIWNDEHLILAPKVSLQSVWERQLKMWTGCENVVAVRDGKVQRAEDLKRFWEMPTPKFLVVNPEMISRRYEQRCKKCNIWNLDVKAKKAYWPAEHVIGKHPLTRSIRELTQTEYPEIIDHRWASVTLDESHDILAGYTPANETYIVQGLMDIKTEHKFALTGTPLRGHERKIWGTLDWFGMKLGGYWGFISEYFETIDNGYGLEIGDLKPDRKEAFYRLIDRNVLRRTRSEVRPDLPMGQRLDRILEMSPKHRKQYEAFEKEGEVVLEQGIMSSLGVLSELTRLKQMAFGVWDDPKRNGELVATAESAKINDIVQWLRERGVTGKKTTEFMPEPGDGYKYVIASQWTETLDAIRIVLDKAGIKSLSITGQVTGKPRNDVQAKFQSNDKEYRVLLLSTTAGGMSIELDAWCDEMYIVDETFVADDQVQLEGRINNRSGRVAPRTWWYARTAGTIDEKIAEKNYNQHDLQHKLLDGRRGVTAALHLLRGEPIDVPVRRPDTDVTVRRHTRRTRDVASHGTEAQVSKTTSSRGPKAATGIPSRAGSEHNPHASIRRRRRKSTRQSE